LRAKIGSSIVSSRGRRNYLIGKKKVLKPGLGGRLPKGRGRLHLHDLEPEGLVRNLREAGGGQVKSLVVNKSRSVQRENVREKEENTGERKRGKSEEGGAVRRDKIKEEIERKPLIWGASET